MTQDKYIQLRKFTQDAFPWLFILGARGTGKTINTFLTAIKEFNETGKKSIYMRRYDTEIETSSIDFNLVSELTGCDITREKYKMDGVITDMILVDDKPAIYMLALSGAGKYKSKSFADVDTIYYDEFLDLYDRELKNETKLFLNFAMTVFRDFTKFKAVFLANSTNLFNNYFLDLEIMPTAKITKFRDIGVKIVMYQTSEELDKERRNTVLAKVVAKVEGEEGSSLDNKFTGSFTTFIKKLGANSRYTATILLNGQKFGMYKDDEYIIISPKFDDNFKTKFALSFQDVSEDYPLINWDVYTTLRYRFMKTKVFFTDVKTRTLFIRKFRKQSLNVD